MSFKTDLWNKEVYPQQEWLPWKFDKPPKGYWDSKENKRLFFAWLGKQLGYKTMADWFGLSLEDICSHGGTRLMGDYFDNSPYKALKVRNMIFCDILFVQGNISRT